jgi:hypothetical protein
MPLEQKLRFPVPPSADIRGEFGLAVIPFKPEIKIFHESKDLMSKFTLKLKNNVFGEDTNGFRCVISVSNNLGTTISRGE